MDQATSKAGFWFSSIVVAGLVFAGAVPAQTPATLVIDSLSDLVTRNEIDSFKAFLRTQSPPRTPWGSSHNAWSFGTGGRTLEAMGMMYEVSGDLEILNLMIRWTDQCVSQRNDLLPADQGGQRVMWTGKVDKVWCPEAPTARNAKYAGCETEDAIAPIVYGAKLILQHPALWKTTVPDGDPYGYGVTYLDRAKGYIAKCDEANDDYFLQWFVEPGTTKILLTAGNSAGSTSATLALTVTLTAPVVPIEVWRTAHFGASATNLNSAGDSADPDGDGANNLLEYTVGTDPLRADPPRPVGNSQDSSP